MIEQIVSLRRKGLSFRKIAMELNSTVGKVQYQWKKYVKEQEKNEQEEEKQITTKTEPKIPFVSEHFWTSVDLLTKKNGMEAWLTSENTALVFWRIPEGKWQLISTYYDIDPETCSLAVKINDITSIIYNGRNAHSYRLLPVENRQESIILQDLSPNRSFCFEIGVLDVYQSFLPILQSNPLHTPRISQNQVGAMEKEIQNWEKGDNPIPNWIEHVSTYSYYELEEQEDVKKK
ncbi:DUF4912 domain-containing protein [Niallia sp. MER TA 168]|uniref:DUF4912 domain-containing protein n=1 Tax=Niallia sp. MER TA 168 TaxID=2939568 RepID=UPI002041DCA0|nr:DUF4912 domain-containing protein [Niallia sp. MER TA 168]MCM3360886.1 DUF4912 domain-containing protein [Niallia sp. MER TA 168]